MDPSELSFCTTQELIDELMRRKTFMGVVVHSEDEWRGQGWGPERNFKVRFNRNLDSGTTGRLLGSISEYMSLYLK